jgi:hypothetical protein
MTRRRKIALGTVACALVALGLVGGGALAAGNDPGPTPAFIRIHLDSTQVNARTYEIDGELKGATKDYTLSFSTGLTADASLTAALQPGATYGTATVEIFDFTGQPLATYTLGEAKVATYRQSGDVAAGTFVVNVVVKAKSFTSP